jgi:hypothetical protein
MKTVHEINAKIMESECLLASYKIKAEQEKLELEALKIQLELKVGEEYPLESLIGNQMIYHCDQCANQSGGNTVTNGHQIFTQDFCNELLDNTNLFIPERFVDGKSLNREFNTKHFSENHDYVIYRSSNMAHDELLVEFVAIAV